MQHNIKEDHPGDLERFRLSQKEIWDSVTLPPLLYRHRAVDRMHDIINTAHDEGRLSDDEGRELLDMLDYIQGLGMGL